jgi:hypothetical protein
VDNLETVRYTQRGIIDRETFIALFGEPGPLAPKPNWLVVWARDWRYRLSAAWAALKGDYE